MALISQTQILEADSQILADNAPIDTDGPITVSLSRWRRDADSLLKRPAPASVRLSPDEDPADLLPWLEEIARIEIDFPKYTDGRGYSQAQLLRRRYGYKGELRAVGHVLRDQFLYMHRSGFDTYQTIRAGINCLHQALNEFSEVYQPAADAQPPVFIRRHSRS